MNVLLVNAVNPNVEVETRYTNLGLGYLASALRKHFGKDAFNFMVIDRGLERAVLRHKPDILCLTSVSQNYNIARKYAAIAKTYRLPVIIGGAHISALPYSLSRDMDVGCIGEGERAIVELFSAFMNKDKFSAESLSGIKGIVYREGDKLIINQPRELIADMDELPFPARDLFKIDRHAYMFTSRGCPYDCIFCSSTKFWKKVRFFSAEYVVREIEELVDSYNVRLISFFDDLFIADKNRLEKITGLLKGKSFYKKVKFTCSARAGLLTDEIAGLLGKMGVGSVGMGLESGTDKILKYLKGENISVEDNKKAIAALNRRKIAVNASFVIGSPRETKEEIMKTYSFIKDNPLSLFDIYALTPYPGTGVWEYARKKKLVSENMDWSRLNVNFNANSKNAVILSEVLGRKELVRLYKMFRLLRLFRNARMVCFTPQLIDLPKILFKSFIEYIMRVFKRGGENMIEAIKR